MNTEKIEYRFCKKCNRDLPRTREYFYPRKTDKNGFNIYCKECLNREKREKRSKKREKWDKGGVVENGEGRRCTKCKKIYPETSEYFGKVKHNSIGLDTYCKICRREKGRYFYNRNKEKWENYKNISKIKNSEEKLNYINKIKEQGCIKCGETRKYILDFHHINPNDKEFQISNGSLKGLKRLKQEIEKCILLCSNCHREFHYFEKKNQIKIEEYLKQQTDFNNKNK